MSRTAGFVHGQLSIFHAIVFHLLGQQILHRNIGFFVFGVARQRITSIRSNNAGGMFIELDVATNITSLKS